MHRACGRGNLLKYQLQYQKGIRTDRSERGTEGFGSNVALLDFLRTFVRVWCWTPLALRYGDY